jgi:hypothetical protein
MDIFTFSNTDANSSSSFLSAALSNAGGASVMAVSRDDFLRKERRELPESISGKI